MQQRVLDKDLSNVIVIHMLTRVNHERIDECPPGLDFAVEDPEHMKVLIDNARKGAYQYDQYTDLVAISCLHAGNYYHFLWCEEAPRITNEGNTIIRVSSSERDVIADFLLFLREIHVEVADTVIHNAALAGWHMRSMWGLLVNKAFSYRLSLPHSLMSDPMRKFQSVDNIIAVDSMYTQGCNYERRPPSLGDVLTYWGYGERSSYKSQGELNNAICTNSEYAAAGLEVYLRGMRNAVDDYYGIVKK